MKILIVDDEQTSRKLIRGFVSRFAVWKEAEEGREAVDAFINAWGNGSPFDIMSLDVEMPEIRGAGGPSANQRIGKIGYSLLDEKVDLLDLDSAKHLNLDQNSLDKIIEEVKKQVQSSGDMFN